MEVYQTNKRDVIAIAAGYIRRGWAPIPVIAETKRPRSKGWKEQKVSLDEISNVFGADDNVGVLLGKPSSGLVDFDLDCDEALAVAPDVLDWFGVADTASFGRESRPRSHFLFVVQDAESRTRRFSSPSDNHSTLLEIRSTGQTVFPGSWHSGEAIRWEQECEPVAVGMEQLRQLAGFIAAAALLVRNWPNRGSGRRQEATLALAGGLCRMDLNPDQVEHFVRIVVSHASDEEAEKRGTAAADTCARQAAGKSITGWTKLAEIIGKPVVDCVKSWLGGNSDTACRVSVSTSADQRPVIKLGSDELPVITDAAWKAVVSSNDPPRLFQFGGRPVRLRVEQGSPPILEPLTVDRLRHEVARVARWVKGSRGSDESVVQPAGPPLDVIKDMLAAERSPLPALDSIVSHAVVSADGRFYFKPGYHTDLRMFIQGSDELGRLTPGTAVTDAEVTRSKALIEGELLADFPFVSQAEKAHAIGLLLLPFVRRLIDGPTPLHLIEKPTPGTGASLLAAVLTLPALGHPVTGAFEARSDSEWRKRLLAFLLDCPEVLLFDNLRHPLDSAALSAVLTQTEVQDRLLGVSSIARVPNHSVWIATANNPRLSDEIARRTVRIRLDAKCDRPGERSGWRHHDLLGWAKLHRSDLVQAACVLIQSWLEAGHPDVPTGTPQMGMFESWRFVIGGILHHASIQGFLGNVAAFNATVDPAGEATRALVSQWWDQHQDQPQGVSDLFELADALEGLPIEGDTDRARQTRLGKFLARLRDRTFDLDGDLRLRLERAGIQRRAVQWRLVRC